MYLCMYVYIYISDCTDSYVPPARTCPKTILDRVILNFTCPKMPTNSINTLGLGYNSLTADIYKGFQYIAGQLGEQ